MGQWVQQRQCGTFHSPQLQHLGERRYRAGAAVRLAGRHQLREQRRRCSRCNHPGWWGLGEQLLKQPPPQHCRQQRRRRRRGRWLDGVFRREQRRPWPPAIARRQQVWLRVLRCWSRDVEAPLRRSSDRGAAPPRRPRPGSLPHPRRRGAAHEEEADEGPARRPLPGARCGRGAPRPRRAALAPP